jgi:endonuclease G
MWQGEKMAIEQTVTFHNRKLGWDLCTVKSALIPAVVAAAFFAFPNVALADTAADCPAHFYDALEPVIVKQSLLQRSDELCFEEFALFHSGLTKTPLWSAEHLTRERVVDAKAIEREDVFHPEDKLAAEDRAELRDYVRSGYDRGHMSPSADMATAEGQAESFSLANMIPQNSQLNRNLWAQMETTVRGLTKKYDDVYVVTGPAFVGNAFVKLNGRVIVPSHVYKAVYIPKVNAAAVWWAPNSGDGRDYEVISLDQLKERTGIDAFPSLDASTKATAAILPKPSSSFNRNFAGNSNRSIDSQQTGSIPHETQGGWMGQALGLTLKLLK